MPPSYFQDKTQEPTMDLLSRVLKNNYELLQQVISYLESKYGPLNLVWRNYGKSGWLLKIMLKKRNLVFCVPNEGNFNLNFVFGDRAVETIMKGDFPETIKNEINQARKYSEGRGLLVRVTDASQLPMIFRLFDVKIAH